MIALPWYLLAGGIVLMILGYLWAVMARPGKSPEAGIDEEMDDEEIVRNLNQGQGISFPGVLILAGMLCVLISIVWRIVRWFT